MSTPIVTENPDTYVDVEALRIDTPKPKPIQKRLIDRCSLHRHCGTICFVVIQTFFIISMVKISMNNPFSVVELLIFALTVCMVYCGCIALIVAND